MRWWGEMGNLLLTGDERAIVEKQARLEGEAIAQQAEIAKQQAEIAKQQAEEIAEQERRKKEKLEKYLRSLGMNPDDI